MGNTKDMVGLKKYGDIELGYLTDDDIGNGSWHFQGNFITEDDPFDENIVKYFSKFGTVKAIGYHPKPVIRDKSPESNPMKIMRASILKEEYEKDNVVYAGSSSKSKHEESSMKVLKFYSGGLWAVYTQFYENPRKVK